MASRPAATSSIACAWRGITLNSSSAIARQKRRRAIGRLSAFVWIACLALIAVRFPVPTARADDLVGTLEYTTVSEGETLLDIARRYGLGVPELMAANPGVDPWIPKPGHRLVLPTLYILPPPPREGLILNLAMLRLFQFDSEGQFMATYPLGVGRSGFSTPLGRTTVVRKRENPTWYPTPEARRDSPDLPAAMPPGPENPLGRFALDLGWTSYAIHGTHRPWGVGRLVSRGCIRLLPEHIETLFAATGVGTPVRTLDDPIGLGWRDGALYLEVHPSRNQIEALEDSHPLPAEVPADLRIRVADAVRGYEVTVDWDVVTVAGKERSGIPVRVTR